MKKHLLFLLYFCFSSFIFCQNYASFVNPFIGTAGTGHTYPGASLPFGLVQLSPDTRIDGSWEGCSGYYYSDSIIYGFSHTHLSGTGGSDYGDIMLMPVTKKEKAFTPNQYASTFNHKTEVANAGFYSVKLAEANVTVNLTTTLRTGFHQYIFNENENALVVLDLNHRDKLLEGEIELIDDHTVAGYRYSEAWAKNQKIFFYLQFSKKLISTTAIDDSVMVKEFKKINGQQLVANFFFDINKNDTLLVKVGVSGTSIEGAKLNLQTENTNWDFNAVCNNAKDTWNKELGKIDITCEKKSDYEVFYTALYHTMLAPNTYNDVDGKYRGMDDKIHTKKEDDYYTVFSLWDTFRAAHPLYTLIDQQRTKDYVNTFIEHFKAIGRLPVWELASNETECMIGIHSLSVIADAISKGLVPDSCKNILANAIIATSNMIDYKGIGFMNSQHYISSENDGESVSKTLEYSYQYYCMAVVCKWAGKLKEANTFEQISLGYKNLFNPDFEFFSPRENGGWLPNFNPKQVNKHYTEANAWQYAFFVPHDITGMIELYGGKEKLHAKLDSFFNSKEQITGRKQIDITGLIGQYAQGNEPSHHIAYLYNYIGDFNSAHKIVSKICTEFYTNKEDGLCGNDDCGQLSAWYVFSALGLYQVNPGSPYFTFTVPQVLGAKINLENKKTIIIKKDIGDINCIYWNKEKLNNLYISYNELMQGGELFFENNKQNNIGQSIGLEEGDILKTSSIPNSMAYIASPIITANELIFKKETIVKIKSIYPTNSIYYGIKKNKKKLTFIKYKSPFTVKNNCEVVAYVFNEKDKTKSSFSYSNLHKYPNNFTIEIKSKANAQYFPNGPLGLIDGIQGDINWQKGNWHGYQGQDFEAVIDTKKKKKRKVISAGFLADNKNWIYHPVQIELYASNDTTNFTLIKTLNSKILGTNTLRLNDMSLTEIRLNIDDKPAYRFYKIKAINYGPLPKGHQGQGYPSFIFIDEIKFN